MEENYSLDKEFEMTQKTLDFLNNEHDTIDDAWIYAEYMTSNNTSMQNFTQYLNKKYKILDVLWEDKPKDFFSTSKSRNFYKQILRIQKIKLIL